MQKPEYDNIRLTTNWIKIRRYTDDSNLSWQERYEALERHHIEETEFLISKIRKLAERMVQGREGVMSELKRLKTIHNSQVHLSTMASLTQQELDSVAEGLYKVLLAEGGPLA